jgi:hypothetical protein
MEGPREMMGLEAGTSSCCLFGFFLWVVRNVLQDLLSHSSDMGARVRCTAAVAAAVVVCLLFLALREDSKLIAQEEGHNAHAGPGTHLNSAQGLLTIASREKQEEALVKPSPEASAPDPDAQKMASPGSGVILYSYGRSATDTFANTIRTAAGWEYCNGRKEGFKESHVQGQGKTDLSQHALQKCLDSGQRLTHREYLLCTLVVLVAANPVSI